MLNRVALIAAAAATFGLGSYAARLGPVVGSVALIVLGLLLALAASGTVNAISSASGAIGAFAAAVLATVSPVVAGSVLLGLCFAERTMRVRGAAARATHVGIVLIAGALAGAISAHYVAAGITVRLVVVVVAAVLAALPLLVEADDPLAHALDGVADDLPEPVCGKLHEGAELRRTVDASMLDGSNVQHANKTWAALMRLAQARQRLEKNQLQRPARAHGGAIVKRLDERIGEHVQALARIYCASDEAKAAEVSLDDGPLRSVETSGESLEEMSKAIVEEVASV